VSLLKAGCWAVTLSARQLAVVAQPSGSTCCLYKPGLLRREEAAGRWSEQAGERGFATSSVLAPASCKRADI